MDFVLFLTKKKMVGWISIH